MWKPNPDPTLSGTRRRPDGGVMAHRRTLGGRKLLAGIAALILTAILLAGSVYVSNRVTGLRTEIAQLDSRREFLEAGTARLLTSWNKATAPAVIIARARKELVLIPPAEPDLVLVQLPATSQGISAWRRLLDNVGGADVAQAAPLPAGDRRARISLSRRNPPTPGDG